MNMTAEIPPVVNNYFGVAYPKLMVLMVPEGSADAYRKDDYWKNCKDIREYSEVVLNDDELYQDSIDFKSNVTYIRHFANTDWQALYVPFAMNYKDWQADFEVASIHGVHQFDDDTDGIIDRTQLEVIVLPEGADIVANRPYLIRAKSTGTKELKMYRAKLHEKASKSIDCSSTEVRYVFTGTYDIMSGSTMYDNHYAVLCNNKLQQVSTRVMVLCGYRWYMKAEDFTGAPVPTGTISLRVVRDGQIEVEEEDPTDMQEMPMEATRWPADIYDLAGRVVRKAATDCEGLPQGMYIVNGKKIVVQ